MIRESIGNTPLRHCDALSTRYHTNIFIKEEFHNPGMSAKDRPALFMIEDAIAKKKIKPGGIFVEASSGNTGLGIALVAKKLGYRAKIFVSQSCSQEKVDLLIKAGADIEICENSNGLHDFNSTQFRAQSFAASHPNAYFTNQYYNTQNIRAHYKTTAPEIWEQTKGNITHFIAGVGTGGTVSGVGRFLKEQQPEINIWGVEPYGSILAHFLKYRNQPNQIVPFDPIEGIGRNFVPGSFDAAYVDHIFQVNYQETKAIAKEYYSETGIMTGFSSAAVIASLKRHVENMKFTAADTVVLFFPDHGNRYISKLYKGSVHQSIASSNITSF
ncbi:PLP-dependent cysteine synthase family protein [Sphingobacterium sp. SGR-19]|uniref:PLP-dependent cysteine synthase family protein n=1 Tax=Sphingobacterium sp. SGR-19 TaxID=2710886 RepID=UPI0013EBF873|nr:cysteine synthase family protein [Sphingobacterium sp. SGR-19]NGM65054.1 cysteine synthase family protein [Sphingobacterium sp. SGR-19]